MSSHIKILLVFALVFGGIALTFKVEDIGEVCSLSGTSRTYKRYFGLFATKPKVRVSWVEQILRSSGEEMPDYDWVRTNGDTWTVMGFMRLHSRAPIIYPVRTYSVEFLRGVVDDRELLDYAQTLVSGDAERQKEVVDTILYRLAHYDQQQHTGTAFLPED